MVLGYFKTFAWGVETLFEETIAGGQKKHSIRKNESGRIRAGVPLSHVFGNRTPQRREFFKNSCTGSEPIKMVFSELGKLESVFVNGAEFKNWEVVAKNDGLCIGNFETFFYSQSEGGIYSGSIIHWTDLRYGA